MTPWTNEVVEAVAWALVHRPRVASPDPEAIKPHPPWEHLQESQRDYWRRNALASLNVSQLVDVVEALEGMVENFAPPCAPWNTSQDEAVVAHERARAALSKVVQP
jgi:hypothetical protein